MDWSTIRRCNLCGRAVAGRDVTCRCGSSALSPHIRGTFIDGKPDFGGAASVLRRFSRQYILVVIPVCVVFIARFRLLPVDIWAGSEAMGREFLSWVQRLGVGLLVVGFVVVRRVIEIKLSNRWHIRLPLRQGGVTGASTLGCILSSLLLVVLVLFFHRNTVTAWIERVGVILLCASFMALQTRVSWLANRIGLMAWRGELQKYARQVSAEWWIAGVKCIIGLGFLGFSLAREHPFVRQVIGWESVVFLLYVAVDTAFLLRRAAAALAGIACAIQACSVETAAT